MIRALFQITTTNRLFKPLVWGLLSVYAPLTFAAGTVGSGTPGSCTEAALDAALSGSGAVNFNCGAAPVSIILTGGKTITADTFIDGGGLVTLDGNGGAFALFQVNDGVNFSILDLTLRNAGAAIWTNTGNLNISGSTISDHNGVGFGAVKGDGILNITQSTIKRNTYTAGSPGAGIWSSGAGTLTIVDSEISGNTQNNGGGAGLFIGSDNALIMNSTFSGNDATGSVGGGMRNDGTGTIIVNSTFTGNSASSGGAIESIAGTLEINYSTIAGNTGTGISNQQQGVTLTLANTIIVANNDFNCNGTFIDGGNNLQFGGNLPTSCGGTIPVIDPLLDILAANGGPTRTMALLPGSPAIDAGNGLLCPPADQRGVSRPVGAGCDIGAFEVQLETPPPAAFQPIPTLSWTGILVTAMLLAAIGLVTAGRRNEQSH